MSLRESESAWYVIRITCIDCVLNLPDVFEKKNTFIYCLVSWHVVLQNIYSFLLIEILEYTSELWILVPMFSNLLC